ncbi:MAG: GNAT family N-acetyltransferase [Bacteroidota bacterium]
MKHTVRKATLEDMPVLLEFKKGLIAAELPMDPTIKKDTTTYYDLAGLIQAEDSEIFVVEMEGEIVATGYAKILEDREYLVHDRFGYLGFMFVPEKYRGNGYNQLVLNALLDWCKSRNIFEIKLDVYDNNPPAIRAYEKAGFKKYLVNMRLNLKDL